MKKFKFNLQTLLKIRQSKEREIQSELARILSIQNRERERQDELKRSIDEQKNIHSAKMRKGEYSTNEAMMFEKFVDISLRAIDTAQLRIEEMEPEINEVRGRLIEASRERKVVEKLKERKLEEYNYDLNREIGKENDEMNQKIYFKRKQESA